MCVGVCVCVCVCMCVGVCLRWGLHQQDTWSDSYDADTLLVAPTSESFAGPCKPASGANYRTKTATWNDSEHRLMECSLSCD